jgi:hypothetical protein
VCREAAFPAPPLTACQIAQSDVSRPSERTPGHAVDEPAAGEVDVRQGCSGAVGDVHRRDSEARLLRVAEAAMLRHKRREVDKALGKLRACVVPRLRACRTLALVIIIKC